MDRGFTIRTYLWAAGSGFIVASSLSFLAYLKLNLPWWTMVVALGLLVGLIVSGLEHVLARPLERLAKVAFRIKEGAAAPPPGGMWSAHETRRVWKAVRNWQEQFMQARHAHKALEAQLESMRHQARMLAAVTVALRPEMPVEEAAAPVLAELASHLGLRDVYLVPLRRHCPVPVTGGLGTPAWGPELRASGFVPWDPMLAQGDASLVSLTSLAPAWREHMQDRPLWVVPLVYHGKAQGVLLAPVTGAERTWTDEERALVAALADVLAAALHPPRWSEERAARREAVDAEPEPVMAGVRPRKGRRRRAGGEG